MGVGSTRWLGSVDSPKPLPLTTKGNPISVTFGEVDVLNTLSRRISVHDGHGMGVGTENLVALRAAIAFEIDAHSLPSVADDKVAKHIPHALTMSVGHSWTPNPILERPAAV